MIPGARDASGVLKTLAGPPPGSAVFMGGLAMSALGEVYTTTSTAGAIFANGYLVSPTGALVVDTAGAIVGFEGGFGLTASGALAMSSAAPGAGDGYVGGQRVANDGHVYGTGTGLAPVVGVNDFRDAVLAFASNYWRFSETAGASVDNYLTTAGLNDGICGGTYTRNQPGLLNYDPDKGITTAVGYCSITFNYNVVGLLGCTYAGIFKPSTLVGDVVVLHRGDVSSSGNQGWWLYFLADGSVVFTIINVSQRNFMLAPANTIVAGNKYLTIVRVNSATSVDLFLNGVKYSATLGYALNNSNSLYFTVGANRGGSYYSPFSGTIDEVFCGGLITDQQAAAIFAAM